MSDMDELINFWTRSRL